MDKKYTRLDFLRKSGMTIGSVGLMSSIVSIPSIVYGSSKNQLKNMRSMISSGNTLVFFTSSIHPKYKIALFENPLRLSIDFSGTDLDKKTFHKITNSTIKNVRTGKQANGDTRVVLDLSTTVMPLNLSTDVLVRKRGRNYELAIKLTKVSRVAFATMVDKLPGIQNNNNVAETNVSRTFAKSKTPNKFTIIIDAGHGGKDPGAVGKKYGTLEKNVTLKAALFLEQELKQNKKFNIILTRKTDKYLFLRDRAEISSKYDAHLFISLHADASPSIKTKGLSTYTLSQKASDEESEKLAQRENAADLIGITGSFKEYTPDLQEVLSSLSQRKVQEASIEFANAFIWSAKNLKMQTLPNPVRSAGFAVLKSNTPSTLIEMGFLSNADEETLLRKDSHIRRLCKTLSKTISSYDFLT